MASVASASLQLESSPLQEPSPKTRQLVSEAYFPRAALEASRHQARQWLQAFGLSHLNLRSWRLLDFSRARQLEEDVSL